MLALGADGVISPEEHDAFLRVGEAVPILARHASFLGCRLFVVSFFWPTSLSQEMFEELVVLVEVFDGVDVVGAWTIHELVEVVRKSLLGLLAHAISRGDQRGVVQSMPILFVLLAPLCGGALVLVRMLGLDFVLASTEDRSDRLLARGVVSGDVKQVAGGTGLQAVKLVLEGLTGRPGEECADDVCVDDIREGVASLGEPVDVIPRGLAGLLLVALEVPGVSRVDLRPLEISDEDPL